MSYTTAEIDEILQEMDQAYQYQDVIKALKQGAYLQQDSALGPIALIHGRGNWTELSSDFVKELMQAYKFTKTRRFCGWTKGRIANGKVQWRLVQDDTE